VWLVADVFDDEQLHVKRDKHTSKCSKNEQRRKVYRFLTVLNKTLLVKILLILKIIKKDAFRFFSQKTGYFKKV